MSDAQVETTRDGAILFDAAACAGARPDARWFDAAHWLRQGGAEARTGGRGGVAFVETPAGACVLRHYHRGGLAARVSADHYVWTGAERSRAFREFRLLDHLVRAGLPAPAPVAAHYERHGLSYVADLLVCRIPATETLAERLAAGALDAALARRIGETIARFHAAGACHADLNAHNILIDKAGVVSLIDFDRGRLRKPALGWQQANLARLRRSMKKLGAEKRIAGFNVAFWHPLLAAYHDALATRPSETVARGALR
jgi:3-deoxy-D-manno-octulosonic acid kinase